MFKKDEFQDSTGQPQAPQTSAGRTPAPHRSGGQATIGPSITIKGDVSGNEDLMIQGRIEGKVKLAKHNVTIGSDGKVKADVHGRTVVVEGEVEGDIHGQEQIILRNTARVEGSIAAPRVALEDGAVFRGGIEMDAGAKENKPADAKHTGPIRKGGADKEGRPVKAELSEKEAGKSLPA